ncbi:MAG: hypothetical protein H6713_11285 [Myxococcales bacterium]|nr:hypothetical protein [Myxococcales bacterium]
MSERERSQGVVVDVASLLTIDVDAELRKLTSAQLQGPWQVPSELVRRALRSGAREVAVTLARQRIELVDDGAGVDGDALSELALLLDPGAGAELRHRALLSLESRGELELLALSGLDAQEIALETTSGGQRLALLARRGATPKVTRVAGAATGTRVQIRGLRARFDVVKARTWVREMCRFAPGVITLDGQSINTRDRRIMCTASLEPLASGGPGSRVKGSVMLTHSGEHARIWLLQHGVVTTHVGVNNAPCFEAAIDFGAGVSGRATAAELRAEVGELLTPLVAQAARLMLRLATRMPELVPPVQERVRNLLLRAARRGNLRAEIREAPILARVVSHEAPPRWISVVALEREVAADPSGYRHVQALYPDQAPERFSLQGPPVLVLDAAARSALSELCTLRFHPPTLRADGRTPGERLRRWLGDAGQAVRAALRFGGRRPIPEHALRSEELRFLEALRAVLEHGGKDTPDEVHFCRGRGAPVRVRGRRSRLLLPRESREIQALQQLVHSESAWLYPASLALLGGHGLPSSSARATWVRVSSRFR